MRHEWWPAQPVLEVEVNGAISTRAQAYELTKTMVDDIEQSGYPHVVVILDLTSLGQSPSATTLLAGSLPETLKIEHLVMVNAPQLFRLAAMPFIHLRNKLHFVSSLSAGRAKATDLLVRLPRK